MLLRMQLLNCLCLEFVVVFFALRGSKCLLRTLSGCTEVSAALTSRKKDGRGTMSCLDVGRLTLSCLGFFKV